MTLSKKQRLSLGLGLVTKLFNGKTMDEIHSEAIGMDGMIDMRNRSWAIIKTIRNQENANNPSKN